ncbi:hypothetical protein ONZ45_g13069 [Pleurotus djamor]|nr:hypothetical protein ONZ45_g13069 [Pleurotus djamor]
MSKRAAGSNAEGSGSRHASKKTRFQEPNEDPANFSEQVDSALEDPSTRRKGRVKQEGYDSDSSDDGEGVVFSRKKAEGGGDDEDDDMFAMGDKEDKEEEVGGKKKKKDEYLRLGDIEGQEFKEDGDGSKDSEESEIEDEDHAERRKKLGMGYELSSFNMKEEMEEGKFTEDGMYVRTFDPHGVHDRWMDGLDEKEIKQARKRKKKQEREQQQKMQAEETELAQSGGPASFQLTLLAFLKKGETVLEALQRLGKQKQKPKDEISQVTHLASTLMGLGDSDIYSRTYEELLRDVRRAGLLSDSATPPSADAQFEYKWDVPEVVGQTPAAFGPFSEDEMKAWYKASYFGPSGDKVKVRKVGGEWGDWDDVIS